MAGSLRELSAHRYGRAKGTKIIRNASELREQADYEDFYEATQEEAAEIFAQAFQFISVGEDYLQRESIL